MTGTDKTESEDSGLSLHAIYDAAKEKKLHDLLTRHGLRVNLGILIGLAYGGLNDGSREAAVSALIDSLEAN